jgi:hypothetical protein
MTGSARPQRERPRTRRSWLRTVTSKPDRPLAIIVLSPIIVLLLIVDPDLSANFTARESL